MASAKKMVLKQMEAFKLITMFLIIIFHLFTYNYVVNLERIGCDCSGHWQRDFIKYYSLVAIVVTASLFITSMSGSNGRLPILFATLLSIFGLANSFILFFYTKKLMDCDERCQCSAGLVRTMLHYLSAFRVFMVFFALLVSVFLIIFIRSKMKM